MSVFDFNNNRAQNLSNPKFDKDAVNFRTLKFTLFNLTGNTVLNNLTVSNISVSALTISGSPSYNQLRLSTSYTPTGTTDANGATGSITWDNTYLYWKTPAGWLRTSGGTF
jgi:hypothetical protein